ncbi:hypothetical protein BH10BDE1_BH10BDE1_26970 [soil metagenome]
MKHQDDNWSLFRLSDRQQFDAVSLSTIDFFFRAIPENARAEWLMWREGFSGWKPFSELPVFLKHLKDSPEPLKPPPPVPEEVLKYADEITGIRKAKSKSAMTANAVEKSEPAAAALPEFQEEVVVAMMDDDVTISEIREPIFPTAAEDRSSVSVRAINAATSSVRLKTNAAPPRDRRAVQQSIASATSFPHAVAPTSPQNSHLDNGRVLTLTDEATMSLMLDSASATEDRNNVRYQKKFKIRVFTAKGVLALQTIDCSSSGFRLKEPLPAGLPRFFHVELDLGPEGKIPLVCSEIREKDGRGSTRVRIQVNDHINTLKSALVRAA